ncbi:unnamed protein product, partial [Rotaria magnacalcarata]
MKIIFWRICILGQLIFVRHLCVSFELPTHCEPISKFHRIEKSMNLGVLPPNEGTGLLQLRVRTWVP